MSKRRMRPPMPSPLASLRSPLLSGSPRETLENEADRELNTPIPPGDARESRSLGDPEVVEENRETSSPEDDPKQHYSKYRRGYRFQPDYQKASYFLHVDQIAKIHREAGLRGMEISEFVRFIIDDYYERNPLTEHRIRQLLEERVAKELGK